MYANPICRMEAIYYETDSNEGRLGVDTPLVAALPSTSATPERR